MSGRINYLPFLLYLLCMGESINKEFEKYQKDLETRNKKLKIPVQFEADEKLDGVLKELKDKEVTL